MPDSPAEPDSPFRTTPPRRGSGCGFLLVGLLLGAFAIGVIGRLTVATGAGWAHRVAAMLTGRATTIDGSSAAVVERIRKLSRLETVVYSMDKIVVGQKQSVMLPDFIAGDKLLLIAHGEVTAGIDLSLLQPGDVTVKDDSVTIRLPGPVVLSTRIDNERTKVYSRDTGLLVMADPNLETEVRKAAEEQIGQAAVADGILDKAKTNAVASLTALLYGLGFRTVEIR